MANTPAHFTFPTFKSLMEDCPACGERCNGIPVLPAQGGKGILCPKGLSGSVPDGWYYSETRMGGTGLYARSKEAEALWDSITANSDCKQAQYVSRSTGFGSKTKKVKSHYYVSQEAKNALVAELIKLDYCAFNTEDAREDLLRRGLTRDQIIKHKFIDLGQKGYLPSAIDNSHHETVREWLGNNALRGILKGSTSNIGHTLNGYLVPIFNYNGEICGFQRRFYPKYLKEREATLERLEKARKAHKAGKQVLDIDLRLLEQYAKKDFFIPGKYIWTKGHARGGKEVTAHLPFNHELPLQTLKATKPCKTLLLAEGHMKPIVIYEKLGGQFHVLGAAGGSFTSSPTILHHTLRAFSEDYDIQNVVWLADAGSYTEKSLSETQTEYRCRREKELGISYVPVEGVEQLVGDERKAAHKQLNQEVAERSGKWVDSSSAAAGRVTYKRANITGNINKTKNFVERCGLSFSVADWGQLEVEGEKDSLDPDVVNIAKILATLPPEPKTEDTSDLFKPLRLNAFYNNFHRRIAFTFPKAEYARAVVQTREELPALIAATNKKYVVVNTPTGMGKSSIIHEVPFQEMGFARHIYISLTPRNPTTSEIESNFYSLEGRHGGLVIEPGKKTPNGLNVRRRPKMHEEPQTPANCAFYGEHNEARVNGLDGMRICKACPFLSDCRSGEHEHYNYLYQHIQAKQHSQIRCAISALNPASIDETTLITIDEPAQAAPPYEEAVFSVGDIAEYVSLINRKAGFEQGGIVVDSACNLLPGYIIRDNLLGFAAAVDEDLKEKKKLLSQYKSKQRVLRPRALRFVRHLLEGTSWKLRGGCFCASVRNEQTLSVVGSAGKVLFLDATCVPEKFSVEYGIALEDCIFITCEDRATENVKIFPLLTSHWGGRGQKDNPDKLTILNKTREVLKDKYGADGLGVITFSEFAQEGDISWFSESRGSNRFKEKKAVLLTGLPFINVDVVKAYYALNRLHFEALGISEDAYQNICVHEELKQAIGRIRGFHRDEPLSVYIMCNASFPQLVVEGYTVLPSPLKDFGVEEANTPQLAHIDALIPAAKKILASGGEITQQLLGDVVGTCRQAVSKGIKKIGITWSAFVDLVKQCVTSALSVPAARFFGLTPELKEDIKNCKEHLEAGQIDELAQCQELASQAEAVRALQSIQEGWYPKGIRRNDLFYLQTTLLSNITRDFRISKHRQNMSVWDRIVEDWETEQISEDISHG